MQTSDYGRVHCQGRVHEGGGGGVIEGLTIVRVVVSLSWVMEGHTIVREVVALS